MEVFEQIKREAICSIREQIRNTYSTLKQLSDLKPEYNSDEYCTILLEAYNKLKEAL